MTLTYIDSNTRQPAKLGELYGDRDLKIFGEARWLLSSNSVQTRGLSLLIAPRNGGDLVVNNIPNATYSIPTNGMVLWAKIKRDSGTYTLVNGIDLIYFAAGSQPFPQQDWVQLFTRHNNSIVTVGSFLLDQAQYTQLGFAPRPDFDLVVGATGFATLTEALTFATTGSSIYIRNGYTITAVETIALNDIRVVFHPSALITLNTAGQSALDISGSDVTVLGARYAVGATTTSLITINNRDCFFDEARVVVNAGTITNVYNLGVSGTRTHLRGSVRIVSGTVTNTLIDTSTDSDAVVRG